MYNVACKHTYIQSFTHTHTHTRCTYITHSAIAYAFHALLRQHVHGPRMRLHTCPYLIKHHLSHTHANMNVCYTPPLSHTSLVAHTHMCTHTHTNIGMHMCTYCMGATTFIRTVAALHRNGPIHLCAYHILTMRKQHTINIHRVPLEMSARPCVLVCDTCVLVCDSQYYLYAQITYISHTSQLSAIHIT